MKSAHLLALAATCLAIPALPAQILHVPYQPDQTVVTVAPVVGLSADDTTYFLAHTDDFSTLPRNFTSSTSETPQSWDLSNVTDSASSPYADTMFQLTATGGLVLVSIETGNELPINSKPAINLGPTARGIGTDPALPDQVAFMRHDSGEMTFGIYDLAADTLTLGTPFAFDTAAYGTPTGFDFALVNGHQRALVATRDGPSVNPANPDAPNRNFILDLDFTTGVVGQYATIMGSTDKLQDLLYMGEGRLATGYLSSTTGLVQVGDFTPIPEARHTAALAGLLALTLVCLRKRRPPRT